MAEGAFTMAGYDGENSTHDWNTNGFFLRMQERTGLTFTFDQYTSLEKWQAAKEAMFAPGGELPDVLFKAALTTEEMIRYSDSGQLIDLGPLLEENAPNLWALLEAHPDWREAITLPNGKIVALPAIQELAPQNAMWINQAWLDRLGLEAPTDWDSLRQVLTAFRDRDPNGNGRRDEIPVCLPGAVGAEVLLPCLGRGGQRLQHLSGRRGPGALLARGGRLLGDGSGPARAVSGGSARPGRLRHGRCAAPHHR